MASYSTRSQYSTLHRKRVAAYASPDPRSAVRHKLALYCIWCSSTRELRTAQPIAAYASSVPHMTWHQSDRGDVIGDSGEAAGDSGEAVGDSGDVGGDSGEAVGDSGDRTCDDRDDGEDDLPGRSLLNQMHFSTVAVESVRRMRLITPRNQMQLSSVAVENERRTCA
eukprot:3134949-Rhodomonas_salina.1